MIAYPQQGIVVAGIHFDLVLPDTGETIAYGKISVTIEGTEESTAPTTVSRPQRIRYPRRLFRQRTPVRPMHRHQAMRPKTRSRVKLLRQTRPARQAQHRQIKL
jgi:hypothetical protein